MEEKLQTLKTKLKEVHNLEAVMSVLGWDQQVNMPPGGAEARAEQLATLSTIAHEKFTADEIGQLLDDLAGAELPYDSDDGALIRVARRDYERERKLPSELVAEMSRTFSLGHEVWTEARAASDFGRFQETLSRIIDLNRQKAEALGYEDHIYDALLDEYEPGMKTEAVDRVFSALKVEFVPMARAIADQVDRVDDSFLRQDFDEQAQWDFGLLPLQAIGYDLERGRQDKSVHPFTTSFSINDVRITTRISRDGFPSSLFSTLHEAGHALYEQNIDQSLEGTLLADGTSLGVHESQSRLWENLIGRSRSFWRFYYPRLQEFFPIQLAEIEREDFYRAINKVEPSFIRVDADEVTYNLHIFLRFELEQALLEGSLAVSDLPEAWNAKMEAYLSLTPENDAQGVLQDIHWSGGSFGYFPTYTLGNVLSVQFYEQALQAMPDLPERIERGEFEPLLDWLRQNIHRHGRKFTAQELVERITGRPIQARPYLDYIKGKFSEIYDI